MQRSLLHRAVDIYGKLIFILLLVQAIGIEEMEEFAVVGSALGIRSGDENAQRVRFFRLSIELLQGKLNTVFAVRRDGELPIEETLFVGGDKADTIGKTPDFLYRTEDSDSDFLLAGKVISFLFINGGMQPDSVDIIKISPEISGVKTLRCFARFQYFLSVVDDAAADAQPGFPLCLCGEVTGDIALQPDFAVSIRAEGGSER